MAATALTAVAALALAIAALLSAGSPAVIGPSYAVPAPLVHPSRAQERRIMEWWKCAVKATTPAASVKCLPGAGE